MVVSQLFRLPFINQPVKYFAMQPTISILDLLAKTKRGPQVILPKDAAALVGLTGVGPGWRCLDAGSGSGWLAAFIGNLIKPNGKLVSYERDERWFAVARDNITFCGLDDIVKIKHGDVLQAAELKRAASLDLITLDIKEPELAVPRAAKALKPGGFLAVFSPHIEQQMKATEAMRNAKFNQLKTVETIQRPWQVGPGPFTHPEISGLLHTGFWTVARKIK